VNKLLSQKWEQKKGSQERNASNCQGWDFFRNLLPLFLAFTIGRIINEMSRPSADSTEM
jgi:hypothetical protein